MKTRIDEWLEAKVAEWTAAARTENLLEAAEAQEPPANLIPARPEHIIKGAIIWYPGWKNSAHWQQVEEVHKPDDEFKAYTGHDGCRYGLDGAFVEPRVESIKFNGKEYLMESCTAEELREFQSTPRLVALVLTKKGYGYTVLITEADGRVFAGEAYLVP